MKSTASSSEGSAGASNNTSPSQNNSTSAAAIDEDAHAADSAAPVHSDGLNGPLPIASPESVSNTASPAHVAATSDATFTPTASTNAMTSTATSMGHTPTATHTIDTRQPPLPSSGAGVANSASPAPLETTLPERQSQRPNPPRLASGQEIDAKNTLRSHSVIVSSATASATPIASAATTTPELNTKTKTASVRSSNHVDHTDADDSNFYKQMHGMVPQQSRPIEVMEEPFAPSRPFSAQPSHHRGRASAVEPQTTTPAATSISSLTMSSFPRHAVAAHHSTTVMAVPLPTPVVATTSSSPPRPQQQRSSQLQPAATAPEEQPIFATARIVGDETILSSDLPIQTIPSTDSIVSTLHSNTVQNNTSRSGVDGENSSAPPVSGLTEPSSMADRTGVITMTDGTETAAAAATASTTTTTATMRWKAWTANRLVKVCMGLGGLLAVGATVGIILGTISLLGATTLTSTVPTDSAATRAVVANEMWTFINSVTVSGRTIASISTPLPEERAEERALWWLIYEDPLQLRPNQTLWHDVRIQQRYALRMLLSSKLQGDENGPTSTRTSTNECEWPGVSCQMLKVDGEDESRAVVTAVNVSSMELGGSLSAELGLLSALVLLDTSRNNLTGSLPIGWRAWANIEVLHIGYNMEMSSSLPASWAPSWTTLQSFSAPSIALTQSIPTEFGQWTSLVHFDVSTNALTGTLSDAFAQWTRLETFLVKDNKLRGSLPSSFGAWSNVVYFDVGSADFSQVNVNALTGSIPTTWNWTMLRHFSVFRNEISGVLPSSCREWTALQSVNIAESGLSFTLPEWLGAWTNIREFTASRVGSNGPGLTGSLPRSLARWTMLEYFEVNSNKLIGTLPEEFAQWSNLRHFSMVFNELSGSLSDKLGAWSNLEVFDIYENDLTNTLPSSIGNWTNLLRFRAHDNAFNGTLPSSIGRWTNLTEIFNVDRNRLSGTLPSSIGQWSNLITFTVSDNALTGAIPPSIESWTHVDEVFFDGNNFSGSIPDALCNFNISHLVADCHSDVQCSCCTDCNFTHDRG